MKTRTCAALSMLLAGLSAAPAVAYERGPQAKYVVAYSRLGNGKVSGPVRQTPLGPEVRLPGGNWIACRHSCSETLRVETIDYWIAHGPNAVANESGIFGTLQLTHPR